MLGLEQHDEGASIVKAPIRLAFQRSVIRPDRSFPTMAAAPERLASEAASDRLTPVESESAPDQSALPDR